MKARAPWSPPADFKNQDRVAEDIRSHAAFLGRGREVVASICQSLSSFVENYASTHTERTIIPIDIAIFLSTNAARRLTDQSLDTTPVSDDTPTNESGVEGEVEVDETVLDLPGDDLRSSSPIQLPAPTVEDLGRWSAAISSDIVRICETKPSQLYHLIMSINLQIRRAGKEDDGRQYGRDRIWITGYVGPKTREKLKAQGAERLREVRYFGEKAAYEGYFALGVSAVLHDRVHWS
jgi:hypothetical protein